MKNVIMMVVAVLGLSACAEQVEQQEPIVYIDTIPLLEDQTFDLFSNLCYNHNPIPILVIKDNVFFLEKIVDGNQVTLLKVKAENMNYKYIDNGYLAITATDYDYKTKKQYNCYIIYSPRN